MAKEKYDANYLFQLYVLENGILARMLKYPETPAQWDTLKRYQRKHNWEEMRLKVKEKLRRNAEHELRAHHERRLQNMLQLESWLDQYLLPQKGKDGTFESKLKPDSFAMALQQRLLIAKFLEVQAGGVTDRKELVTLAEQNISIVLDTTGDVLNKFVKGGQLRERLALEIVREVGRRLATSLHLAPTEPPAGLLGAGSGGREPAGPPETPEAEGN